MKDEVKLGNLFAELRLSLKSSPINWVVLIRNENMFNTR
jgi:hypothetical protein